jgi:hypothetical protein
MRSRHKKNDDYFRYAVEESIFYQLERIVLYRKGLVVNLEKWRKARDECRDIIRAIDNKIFGQYKDDKNNPPVQRVPKSIIFEAWKSFSVVMFKVNCFGLGSLVNLWDLIGNLAEKYYEKYIRKKEPMDDHAWMTDNGLNENFFNWWNSSMFEDLTSEMEYRGWIKSRYEYMRKC